MSGLSDTIKGFYSEFILRDLLSFVTPGAIIVEILAFGLNLEVYMRDSIFTWILLFGLFYITGIGLQSIRECIPFLKFPPLSYQNKYRDSNLGINTEKGKDSETKKKSPHYLVSFGHDEKSRNAEYFQKFRLPFIRTVRNKEMEDKIHERFIILMQASGNSAISFFCAFVIGIVVIIHAILIKSSDFMFVNWGVFSVVCLILSPVLCNNYRIHRQRLLDWELEVANSYILSSRSFSRSHSRRRL